MRCPSWCSICSPTATSPGPSEVRRSGQSSLPTTRRKTDDVEGTGVIDDELLEAEEKMEKAVAVAKDEFAAIRTGRITPAMFSRIGVDYYGARTPVNRLASFTVPEPRMVLVNPYDK